MRSFRQFHAIKPCRTFSFSQPPRETSFIHVNERMMHDSVISRSEFYSSNEAFRVDWDRHHKVSIYIFAFSLQRIGFGNLDNQIWLTELPFTAPNGHRREIFGFSLYRPLIHPLSNQLDFPGVQPPLVCKFSIPGLRQPRRHETTGSSFCNLPGTLGDVAIG